MIGHDIKNYLFSGKKFSDVLDDPLKVHPGILKGIERSRRLAQSMKDLVAPGTVTLNTFPVGDMARVLQRSSTRSSETTVSSGPMPLKACRS